MAAPLRRSGAALRTRARTSLHEHEVVDPVAAAVRRTYDHRIREAIVESGDHALFDALAIPK